MLFFLILPVALGIFIIVSSLLATGVESISPGYFYQSFHNSFICKCFQIFFKSFERIWLPLFTSISIKILLNKMDSDDPLTCRLAGIFILLLTFVSSFLF